MVKLTATQNGPNSSPAEQAQIPAGVADLTAGGGVGGVGGEGLGRRGHRTSHARRRSRAPRAATRGLAFLYPYDKTVFPRGLLAPLLQWTWAPGDADAIQIALSTADGSFTYTGTFGPPPILQMTGGKFIRMPIPRGRVGHGDQQRGRRGEPAHGQPDGGEGRHGATGPSRRRGPSRPRASRASSTTTRTARSSRRTSAGPSAATTFRRRRALHPRRRHRPQARRREGSTPTDAAAAASATPSRRSAPASSSSRGATTARLGVRPRHDGQRRARDDATSAMFPGVYPDGSMALTARRRAPAAAERRRRPSRPRACPVVTQPRHARVLPRRHARSRSTRAPAPASRRPPLRHGLRRRERLQRRDAHRPDHRPERPKPGLARVLPRQQVASSSSSRAPPAYDGHGSGVLSRAAARTRRSTWTDPAAGRRHAARPAQRQGLPAEAAATPTPAARLHRATATSVGTITRPRRRRGPELRAHREPHRLRRLRVGRLHQPPHVRQRRDHRTLLQRPARRRPDPEHHARRSSGSPPSTSRQAPGTDASHPAFYLPAQELLAGNARGFWVLDPCQTDGTSLHDRRPVLQRLLRGERRRRGAHLLQHAAERHVLEGGRQVQVERRLLQRRRSLHQRLLHPVDAAVTSGHEREGIQILTAPGASRRSRRLAEEAGAPGFHNGMDEAGPPAPSASEPSAARSGRG